MNFVLLTGADGVGKTAFYQKYQSYFSDYCYLSLAKQLQKKRRNWRKTGDQMTSYQEMIQEMTIALKKRKNILFELPLSGSVHMMECWIDKAKKAGYQCTLIWIQTTSFDQTFQRIIHRVQSGGIGIAKEVAKDRFDKQEEKVNQLVPFFDCVEYWNNDHGFVRVK